ncbi:class I SAM-dependent methyltransferase [Piscirickettsia salmonis]|uniref:class I SAM-dependent methyltransferase n=1 Tax=Piscirickettsia salmonis TaxID=1238 RepID=UPI003EB7A02A
MTSSKESRVERLWSADTYSKNSETQSNHAIPYLNDFIFTGGERVLDIGSGDGKISNKIASKLNNGGKILCIDSSIDMINFSRNKFFKVENMKFIHCKAESIGWENHFDLVVSFSCLHWIEDQYTVFTNIFNALKNLGNLKVMLYPKCDLLWKAINQTISAPLWKKYFDTGFFPPYYDYDDFFYKNLLNEIGFCNITSSISDTEYVTYPDRSALANFMGAWLPHARNVPSNLEGDFMLNIAENYTYLSGNRKNSAVKIPFRKVEVSAKKISQ